MAKRILFLKYNKPTNESFQKLVSVHGEENCEIIDLAKFGVRIDILTYKFISELLSNAMPFDGVFVGDVFWPTGQNISAWCDKVKIPSYFLQHGQWIYTANKMYHRYPPNFTFVYGNSVKRMVDQWPYGKASKVIATGNPRYDKATRDPKGDYWYLAPPVIHEIVPSGSPKVNQSIYYFLLKLSKSGLCDSENIALHPHYREGQIDDLKKLFPKARFFNPEGDALEIISNSFGVLTHRDSTTVLDAISYGKPIISLNHQQDNSFFPRGYFREFFHETESIEDIVSKVNSEPPKVELENYVERASDFIVLGNSAEKICSIINRGF